MTNEPEQQLPDWPSILMPPRLPFVEKLNSVLKLSIINLPGLVGSAAAFDSKEKPPAPDYENTDAWANLPEHLREKGEKEGPARAEYHLPYEKKIPDADRAADCFYVHPTIYFGYNYNMHSPGSGKKQDACDKNATELCNCWCLATQASAFNQSCRIYAPYYRQASISGIWHQPVLDFAYQDISRAFDYFLAHIAPDAPIVLVGHSQGAIHLTRLIEDRFEFNPALRSRLVCAYVVGARVPLSFFGTKFRNIKEGATSTQIGCIVGWDTVMDVHRPDWPNSFLDLIRRQSLKVFVPPFPTLCTNPITWAPSSDRTGTVTPEGTPAKWLGSINVNVRRTTSQREGPFTWNEIFAKVPKGLEVIDIYDTDLPALSCRSTGKGLEVQHINRKYLGPMQALQWLLRGWLHCEDFGLFYHNIRQNIAQRIEAFSTVRQHRHGRDKAASSDKSNPLARL